MLPWRGFRRVCTRTLRYLSSVWRIKFKDKQASMLLPPVGGSHENHWVSRWLFCTMKRGFLDREPLRFTTSFLWWQSSQNMCQIVDQKWSRSTRKWTRVTPRSQPVVFYSTEKVVLSAGVYIAAVNETFIVILGTQWILCWTMLFATSYKPEGRSLPPSPLR